MNTNQSLQFSIFIANLRSSIWLLGIPSWIFGIADRSFASFADGYLSALELAQLFTASFFMLSWLYLKPEESFQINDEGSLAISQPNLSYHQREVSRCPTQARKLELQNYHMISQEYLLPFSPICQIYHLLNLKHLENVHSFSLNNLRILKVTDFQATAIGGMVKFETIVDSPLNALRIWRQPIAEVMLILHDRNTVELNIPVYGDKRMIVIFHVEDINSKEHKLFIDIYSNLNWPKPILQILLHIASCLTLFEDLPYLRKLAEKKIDRLLSSHKLPTHETMWLYRRFVELYGSKSEYSLPSQ